MNFETANSLKPGDRVIHTTSLLVGRVAVRIPGSMLSLEFPGGLRHYDMHAMGPYQPYVENPSPTKETPCTKPPASTDATQKPQPTTPSLSPVKDSTPRSPAKQGTTWRAPSPGSARGSAEPIDDLAGVPDALLRQQVLAAMTSDLTSIYDLADKFPHGTPHQRIFRLALELVDSGEVERIEDRRGPCYRLKPAEHVAPADPQPPTPKEAPMAKGKSADPDQLELIEVDGPEFKSLRKELQEYDTLRASNAEEISALNNEERAKRKKVLDKAKAAGLKPDEEGGYNLEFGGNRWRISQDAQLRIKKSRAPRREADDDEPEEKSEGKDAKAPELQRDGRR